VSVKCQICKHEICDEISLKILKCLCYVIYLSKKVIGISFLPVTYCNPISSERDTGHNPEVLDQGKVYIPQVRTISH
jgi:hypothetical protein